MKRDFLINIRIWGLHLQITKKWEIVPIFQWQSFGIGLFFNSEEKMFFFFLLPMLGIRVDGIWISWNKGYKFTKDPFIWLFDWKGRYFPMKDYHGTGKVNSWWKLYKNNTPLS